MAMRNITDHDLRNTRDARILESARKWADAIQAAKHNLDGDKLTAMLKLLTDRFENSCKEHRRQCGVSILMLMRGEL
jgi:hypothetical protein